MRAIDFRVRPPIAGYERASMYAQPERTARMAAAFGYPKPVGALAGASLEAYEREARESGIAAAVLTGRRGAPGVGAADNPALVAYAEAASCRSFVFPALDPSDASWRERLAALRQHRCVRGIVLEPGLLEKPVYPDDPSCVPVYELCQAEGLPVMLSAGGNVGPDCSYTSPEHFDRVARDFPRLELVIAHGGYPWITQTLHVAFRRANVYVLPDMYLLMPGNEAYVAAMNGYLSERFLFGTSYPFSPLKASIEAFLAVARGDDVAERVLFRNARALLKLSEEEIS